MKTKKQKIFHLKLKNVSFWLEREYKHGGTSHTKNINDFNAQKISFHISIHASTWMWIHLQKTVGKQYLLFIFYFFSPKKKSVKTRKNIHLLKKRKKSRRKISLKNKSFTSYWHSIMDTFLPGGNAFINFNAPSAVYFCTTFTWIFASSAARYNMSHT